MQLFNLRNILFCVAVLFLGTIALGVVVTLHKPASNPAHIRQLITKGAASSCAKRLHDDPNGSKLSDSTIDNYCSCAITKAMSKYTDAELIARDKGTSVAVNDEDKARFTEGANACVQTLAQK
ncbi:hypothetical protein [Granulicella arctica]|uniref:hypothetical protein n=1 Tax=Granulicella arctica TaxID=940613 RepID=UPI0021E000E0|nr:hypothetical protein [Granulicella arctica]